MAQRYLLYVALEEGNGSTQEMDSVDECVEVASELIRKTFGSGRRLVTFSIGDMAETIIEEIQSENLGDLYDDPKEEKQDG